jgi:transcriptional regulator with XRE-family HTH domain
MSRNTSRLFPALLRHFRTRRGLSQLDLALAADVSARHVGFLELGRARPSREMVLRLSATLDLPLRDQNAMLEAAEFPAEFPEPELAGGLPASIEHAIARMLARHEPFPMVIMDRGYDVLRTNESARRLVSRLVVDRSALPTPPNLLHLLFHPRLGRGSVIDWERTARTLLSRLHRETLAFPENAQLAALWSALLEYPDVPADFRRPDLSAPSDPAVVLRLFAGGDELAFLTTITAFSAPQNVTLDEVRIESYFPLDEATASACERLSQAPEGPARA